MLTKFLITLISTFITMIIFVLIGMMVLGIPAILQSFLYYLGLVGGVLLIPFFVCVIVYEKLMNWLVVGNINYLKLSRRFAVALVFLIVVIFILIADDITMNPEKIEEEGIKYWSKSLIYAVFVPVFLFTSFLFNKYSG